jgi:hypothetical protein
MQVIVKVRSGTAHAPRRGEPRASAADSLTRITEELGVVPEPQHPGIDDPELSSYFSIEVPDAAEAERVIDRLRSSEVIEGAYLKPPDAPA